MWLVRCGRAKRSDWDSYNQIILTPKKDSAVTSRQYLGIALCVLPTLVLLVFSLLGRTGTSSDFREPRAAAYELYVNVSQAYNVSAHAQYSTDAPVRSYESEKAAACPHCVLFTQPARELPLSVCPRLSVYPHARVCHPGPQQPKLLGPVLDALREQPDLGLVDLGAGAGAFSLSAARLGRPVVAVEPCSEGVELLTAAAELGNVRHNIVLLYNSLSEKSGGVKLNITCPQHTVPRKLNNLPAGYGKNVTLSVQASEVGAHAPFRRGVLVANGIKPKALKFVHDFFEHVDIPYIFTSISKRYFRKWHETMSPHGYQPKDPFSGELLHEDAMGSRTVDVMWIRKI